MGASLRSWHSPHNISMELHCPETDDVSHISCRGSDGAVLLLQTLAWQDDGRSAAAGDHWQRLKKKPAAAEGGGGGIATLEFSEIEGTDIGADVVAELPVQIRAEIIAQTSSQCIRHLPTLEAFPSKSFVRRTVLSKCSIPTFALDVCKTNVQLAAASWMRFWPWQRTPTSLRAGVLVFKRQEKPPRRLLCAGRGCSIVRRSFSE